MGGGNVDEIAMKKEQAQIRLQAKEAEQHEARLVRMCERMCAKIDSWMLKDDKKFVTYSGSYFDTEEELKEAAIRACALYTGAEWKLTFTIATIDGLFSDYERVTFEFTYAL